MNSFGCFSFGNSSAGGEEAASGRRCAPAASTVTVSQTGVLQARFGVEVEAQVAFLPLGSGLVGASVVSQQPRALFQLWVTLGRVPVFLGWGYPESILKRFPGLSSVQLP